MNRALLLLLLAAGCLAPTTAVRTTDTRPALLIEGAPRGAVLFVDGNDVGDAASWAGRPDVLRVEAGTHQLEVRNASGAVLFRQRVFVADGTKTIQVN